MPLVALSNGAETTIILLYIAVTGTAKPPITVIIGGEHS